MNIFQNMIVRQIAGNAMRIAACCVAVLGLSAKIAVAQTVADPPGYGDPINALYEGLTYPKSKVDVAAAELGRLIRLNVEAGDRIAKDQIAASLEDDVQRAAVTIAKLQAAMHGEVDAAAAAKEMQWTRLQTLREMGDRAAVRPDELVEAEADYEMAKARHLTAVEQQRLRQREVERHQINLDRRAIRAPMDGLIVEVYHQPGEYVTPSQPAICRMIDDSVLRATFAIPADEIREFLVGMACQVYLVSVAEGVRGYVARIGPEIDGESSTIKVEVDIPNPDGKYRVGDRCTMELIRKPRRTAPGMTNVQ